MLGAAGLARLEPRGTTLLALAMSSSAVVATRVVLADDPNWFVPRERMAAGLALLWPARSTIVAAAGLEVGAVLVVIHDLALRLLAGVALLVGLVALLDSFYQRFEHRKQLRMSRRELSRQSDRVRAWQDDIGRQAKELDLDVVRLSLDQVKFDVALVEWVAERRLRRKK